MIQITVGQILPEIVEGFMKARVSFWDSEGLVHPGADVTVFIPVSDSIEELKKSAIEAAKVLFRKSLE
jgi:hypothetical protein